MEVNNALDRLEQSIKKLSECSSEKSIVSAVWSVTEKSALGGVGEERM